MGRDGNIRLRTENSFRTFARARYGGLRARRQGRRLPWVLSEKRRGASRLGAPGIRGGAILEKRLYADDSAEHGTPRAVRRYGLSAAKRRRFVQDAGRRLSRRYRRGRFDGLLHGRDAREKRLAGKILRVLTVLPP